MLRVPVLLKGDVSGSVEAVKQALLGLQQEDQSSVCRADIVFAGVGEVTASDVAIAQASRARVLAFRVGAGLAAMEDARARNVQISYYDVVYELLEELQSVVSATLAPPHPIIDTLLVDL